MKRIYISGPMTGLPNFNAPAFNKEAARLKAMGFDVVNPVDINPDTTATWHECMRRDIAALVTCDTIALLPGWEHSNGANLELHIASRVGMHIVHTQEIEATPA